MLERRLNAEQRVLDREFGFAAPLHSQQFLDEQAAMRAEQAARDKEIEERRQREHALEARRSAMAAAAQAVSEVRRRQAEQEAARVREAREQYEKEHLAALERQRQAEAAAKLQKRFTELVTERGLDFSAPKTEGSGWASCRWDEAALRAARVASDRFFECARLSLEVDAERVRLGAFSHSRRPGELVARSALVDLNALRDQLELAEIGFERDYAALEALRSTAGDLKLLASLAEADELAAAGALETYLSDDLPELAEVRAAVEQYCTAAFALIARHSERAELRRRAHAAASAAGVAPSMSFTDPDGGSVRPLSIDATERLVREVAAATATALFAGSGIPNHDPKSWFPKF